MNKIISFKEFAKKASNLGEDTADIDLGLPQEGPSSGTDESHQDVQFYMFFQNLKTIKRHVDEILKMDRTQIDNLLKGGHDWASDHVAVSKDDIQEVAEWIKNEIEEGSMGSDMPHHGEEEVEDTELLITEPDEEEEEDDLSRGEEENGESEEEEKKDDEDDKEDEDEDEEE